MAAESAVKLGTVYLVGAGPGDPGLFTLRGAECLRKADVVVFDSLSNSRLLGFAPARAERIPVGKRHGARCIEQQTINELLISRARTGQTVVRLKGGDPFVFGRGGEEAAALSAAGVPYEVVPGVTAGIAAPAYAGIPVTHRELASAVAFVTGHEDPLKPDSNLDWSGLATFPGTLVFYMGVSRLAALAESLTHHGKSAETPVAVIEWGTTPAQRSVFGTLSDITDRTQSAGLCAPAVIVVGQVVSMASVLHWFEDRPLFGQRIVITRPEHQSAAMAERLTALGADVLELPALRTEPPADWTLVDQAINELERYGWLVFTSANGVSHFLGRVLGRGRDFRLLGGVRIAAIGAATASELERFHLNADLVPEEANSESLVEAILATSPRRRLLLLRADHGRETLPDGLRAAGIPFDEVTVYRTVEETNWDSAVLECIVRGEVDWITITSPRTVQSLAAHLPDVAKRQMCGRTKLASISRLTSSAALELNWEIAAEAETASGEGLVDAVVEWVRKHRGTRSH